MLLPGTREKLPPTIRTTRSSQRIGAVASVAVVAEELAVATEEVVAVSEVVEVVAREAAADEAGQGDTTMTSMCSQASAPEII